jgi:hypothetical protein
VFLVLLAGSSCGARSSHGTPSHRHVNIPQSIVVLCFWTAPTAVSPEVATHIHPGAASVHDSVRSPALARGFLNDLLLQVRLRADAVRRRSALAKHARGAFHFRGSGRSPSSPVLSRATGFVHAYRRCHRPRR